MGLYSVRVTASPVWWAYICPKRDSNSGLYVSALCLNIEPRRYLWTTTAGLTPFVIKVKILHQIEWSNLILFHYQSRGVVNVIMSSSLWLIIFDKINSINVSFHVI